MKRWCIPLFSLVLSVAAAGCNERDPGSAPEAASASASTTKTAEDGDAWGTIKGQVVWDGGDAPKPAKVDVKGKEECLKDGPVFDERLVINAKNKGVRYCIVYLIGPKDFNDNIPIHPKLKEVKPATVELDQPCCQFTPHMLAMREGQTLIVKNSAGFTHNTNIIGGAKPPNINQIIPSKGKFTLEDIKARPIPMEVKCDIHPWMSARIAVLKNPYFAVTDADGKFEIKDAPAGKFRIVVWHEEVGWVIGDKNPTKKGKEIDIKADATTDLDKIPMKPSKD